MTRAFWDYEFMRNAFAAGTVIAIVAGVVGYFVVLRSLSFAAHALSHIGFAGATGAALLVGSPDSVFLGLLVFSTGSGIGMGVLGNRIYGRDVAIGIILAFALGLGSLFLALYRGYANYTVSILFGDIVGISSSSVLTTVLAGMFTLVLLAIIYRPLLFSSLDQDVAEARGVSTRALAIAFMVILAVAVSNAVQVVGVLLVFSLMVTPAATAQRITARPLLCIALSAGLAVLYTWVSLVIAYYVPWPMSFFVTTLGFLTYIVVRTLTGLRNRLHVLAEGA